MYKAQGLFNQSSKMHYIGWKQKRSGDNKHLGGQRHSKIQIAYVRLNHALQVK